MISGELEWLVGNAQKSIKKNKKMFEASSENIIVKCYHTMVSRIISYFIILI